VGQTLPVARRYRERGERLWVIELADGSRQYVPASWCTPLASAADPPGFGRSPAEEDPSVDPRSPLSLAGLRDLAGLVRHLREREKPRRDEHGDETAPARRRPLPAHHANATVERDEHQPGQRVTRMEQLSAPGSAPRRLLDRPDGPPAAPARITVAGGHGAEVKEG
jgi:hypothetical protein